MYDGFEKEKASRFQRGLRTEIWQYMAPVDITSYTEVVQRAQLIETNMIESRAMSPRPHSIGRD